MFQTNRRTVYGNPSSLLFWVGIQASNSETLRDNAINEIVRQRCLAMIDVCGDCYQASLRRRQKYALLLYADDIRG
jgi:hypothetical protein